MTTPRGSRHNDVRDCAEIAADVGDDGAYRAAADLGVDLLGRGQASLAGAAISAGGTGRSWLVSAVAARGGAGSASSRVAVLLILTSSALARRSRMMRARIRAISRVPNEWGVAAERGGEQPACHSR